jgi:fucose permease
MSTEGTAASVAPSDAPVAAYLLGFALIGIALSALGPALSHLRDRLHTNDGGVATVFAAQAIGYILGTFVAGRVLDRGRGHQWWSAAMVVATLGVAVGGSMPDLATTSAVFAVVGGACGLSDVCGNTLIMWSRPEGPGSLLNALHLFFAIGALSAPLLVNRSLHFTHSLAGVAVPMGMVTIVASARMLRSPAPVRTRLDTVARSHAGGARSLHVVLVCVFFFAYVGLEGGFAGWLHTYTEQIHYGGAGTATGMITMFWVGFALGRVVAIWLAARFSAGWIVAVSCSFCVGASALFAVFRGGGPMLWVVTFVLALSVAPQYASMMAFAESHLALSGKNTAAIIGASGFGGLLLPWLLGQLFDAVGPKALPFTTFAMALVTAVAAGVAGRVLLRAQRPPVTSMKVPVA